METVEFTWLRTIKIWWYWLWRSMLLAVVVSLVAGFLLGMVLATLGISDSSLKLFGNVLGGLIGIFFGLLVLKSLPKKAFSDFSVVLVKRDSSLEQGDT